MSATCWKFGFWDESLRKVSLDDARGPREQDLRRHGRRKVPGASMTSRLSISLFVRGELSCKFSSGFEFDLRENWNSFFFTFVRACESAGERAKYGQKHQNWQLSNLHLLERRRLTRTQLCQGEHEVDHIRR